MMSQKSLITFAAIMAVVLVVGLQSVFIVDQREQAIVLQFGQPRGEPREAGLHVKMPFIQNVRTFDRRILSVDPAPEQVVISSTHFARQQEKKPEEPVTLADGPSIDVVSGEPIIVDTFARYKITNPLQFLKTLQTVGNANSRLETILNDATRAILGQTTLKELLSQERTSVMDSIRDSVNRKIKQDQLGIEIIDVRIVRADLTPELRLSTVTRMKSELEKRAKETRAKGAERAQAIRSTADKERTVLLADAQRDAQIKKGEGDKEAIKIYADAFSKDTEFYAFIRSMEAYKNTLGTPDTRLILSPKSDFFRYFDSGNSR